MMMDKLRQDSHWCQYSSLMSPKILDHSGSMTEKLAELSGQKPLILNLEESIQEGDLQDCLSLGEQAQTKLWQRKIILGNEAPWLLGYSLAYPATDDSPLKPLQTMGASPLGNKLFASDEVWRLSYQTGFVGKEQALWQHLQPWLNEIDHLLWGRRSLFNFHQQALLIYEVFLPTCPGFNYPYE